MHATLPLSDPMKSGQWSISGRNPKFWKHYSSILWNCGVQNVDVTGFNQMESSYREHYKAEKALMLSKRE